MFNFQLIIQIWGILLIINGFFMLTALPFSLFYENTPAWKSLFFSGLLTAIVGFLGYFLNRNLKAKELKRKDGYLVVTGGWILMSLFGSFPYLFSDSIPSFTNAFFETISGYSTTGATILTDIEAVDKGILFWRSLTQWIGGMGIIVLAVAILPILGIGGMQLFGAEAPGIAPDKLQPRIKETAKRLWYIYLGLTLGETILLMVGGMSFYDAINHSLTTMATGGFSTKNSSVAFYDSPFIQYVMIFFMFIAGTSFTLSYFVIKGKFAKVWASEEFRYYLLASLIGGLVAGSIITIVGDKNLEASLRDGLFQVVSVITTTGYITADYTTWTPFLTMFFFLLMFVGASAGSTAGGVKIVRYVLLIKTSFLELKRQIHPSAVIPVRLNQHVVSQDISFKVLSFLMIYLILFATGVVIMSLFGLDFLTAMGSVATCLGNIGPGLGTVGPVDNFAHLPIGAKWFLSFAMLLGRLELFTVLILFSPHFWQKN